MLHAFLFLLASSAVAAPDPPASEPTSEVAQPSFKDQLEGAKRLYFQGQREEALDVLNDLQVRYLLDPTAVDWAAASETLVYLGEVHYFLDDLDRAGSSWRILLEREPNYPALSPFAHPPEVAGEFERLRAIVRAEIAARPIPKPPPVPAWTVLPLGLPQFIDGHPIRGVLYGGAQTGLAAGSLLTIGRLRSKNLSDNPHPDGWTEEEQARRINLQRYALQWPMTFGFYGLWLGSHLDARTQWRRSHPAEARLGLSVDPGHRVEIRVAGRF